MIENSKLVLQCTHCKRLFKISKIRWNSLLQRWGNATNVVQNYLCKSCDKELPLSPGVSKNNIFSEHASPEELILLNQTIDNQRFNKDAVLALLDKISLYKRVFTRTKQVTRKISPSIRVISEDELKQFEQKYQEYLLEAEKEIGGKSNQTNIQEDQKNDRNS